MDAHLECTHSCVPSTKKTKGVCVRQQRPKVGSYKRLTRSCRPSALRVALTVAAVRLCSLAGSGIIINSPARRAILSDITSTPSFEYVETQRPLMHHVHVTAESMEAEVIRLNSSKRTRSRGVYTQVLHSVSYAVLPPFEMIVADNYTSTMGWGLVAVMSGPIHPCRTG
eukprot:3476134-Pyramimonas_sp.AAC.2